MFTRIEFEISELDRIKDLIDEFCEENEIQMKDAYFLNLAVDEILTNIFSYGMKGTPEPEITLSAEMNGDHVVFIIADNGPAFDPQSVPDPDFTPSLADRRVGGLGIYFVKKSVDSFEYRYEGGFNTVILSKKIKKSDAG